MIKVALLVAFFLTLTLDEFLDIGLVITTGLSAKNAFLYVLLLVILCSKVLEQRRGGIQFPLIHLLFFLLIANASLSIFFMHFVSGDTAGFGLFGHVATLKSQLVDLYLFLIVFFYAIDSRASAVWFCKLFLVVVCLAGLITLVDMFGVPNLGLVEGGVSGRLSGPLGGPNLYGVFFAFFTPILVLGALGLSSKPLRVIYGLGAIVSFMVLIMTGSRGGVVALVGGLLLAAWWLRGGYDTARAAKLFAVVAVVAVSAFLVVYVTNEDFGDILQDRVARSTEGGLDEISAGRLWLWLQGLEYMMARPWTFLVGAGWASFWDRVGMSPHSVYINYFFSLGLVGLCLFLAILYWTLVTLKRAYFHRDISPEERVFIGGLVIGWFVIAVAMSTGTLLTIWAFVWPLTGVCLRVCHSVLVEPEAAGSTGHEPLVPLPQSTLKRSTRIRV